eukprot:gene30269-40232_t
MASLVRDPFVDLEDWRILRTLAVYRLALIALLLAVHFLELSAWFFDHSEPGNFFRIVSAYALPALLLLVGQSILIALQWPLVGGMALFVVFAFLWVNLWVVKVYVRPANLRSNALDSRIGGALADALSANPTVKSFGAEAREEARFGKLTSEWRTAVQITWSRFMDIWLLQNLLTMLLQAVMTGTLVWLWTKGRATPGDIAFGITTFMQMNGYLRNIGENVRMFQKGVDDVEDVANYAGMAPQVADPATPQPFRAQLVARVGADQRLCPQVRPVIEPLEDPGGLSHRVASPEPGQRLRLGGLQAEVGAEHLHHHLAVLQPGDFLRRLRPALGPEADHVEVDRLRVRTVVEADPAGDQPAPDAFERIVTEMVDGIKAAMPLDAVYLDLHGARVTEHLDDGEGEIAARVREVIGPDIPFVISLDLHGNISPELVDYADALIAYRTYPHVDMADTGRACARHMELLLAGNRYAKAFRQLPFLIPISWQCTNDEPTRSIYTKLAALEDDQVPTLSFCPGFPAADFPHCGPSVFTYGVTQADADAAADVVVALVSGHEDDFDGRIYTPDDGVRHAMELAKTATKPIVIADTQDNPGAGGDSDTTGMLRALVANKATRAAIGVIYDPAAASPRAA